MLQQRMKSMESESVELKREKKEAQNDKVFHDDLWNLYFISQHLPPFYWQIRIIDQIGFKISIEKWRND